MCTLDCSCHFGRKVDFMSYHILLLFTSRPFGIQKHIELLLLVKKCYSWKALALRLLRNLEYVAFYSNLFFNDLLQPDDLWLAVLRNPQHPSKSERLWRDFTYDLQWVLLPSKSSCNHLNANTIKHAAKTQTLSLSH